MKHKVNKIIKPSISLTSFSIFILSVLIVISVVLVFRKVFDDSNRSPLKKDNQNLTSQSKKEESKLPNWVTYKNSEYGFSLKIPSFLSKEEIVSNFGYEKFIKLNKTQASFGDSVYIGITKSSYDEELDNVKNLISLENGQLSADEKNVIVSGSTARIIHYPSTENTQELSILVVKSDKGAISISSSPEQIEIIKDTFLFL